MASSQNRADKGAIDLRASASKLHPRQHEWLLRAAQTDYHSLVRLLREDPDLYGFKDFASGYTALHWAAKHGSAEIVKLIAGSYGLNPNVKSHGGYTPLHLAYMFAQNDVADLLLAYGADANVLDNSGRKPCQYQKGGIPRPVKATGPSGSRNITHISGSPEKNLCLKRLGSFNSRLKWTAAVLTSPFCVQKLKPWHSADSVAEGARTMGPPKGTAKKKMFSSSSECVKSLS